MVRQDISVATKRATSGLKCDSKANLWNLYISKSRSRVDLLYTTSATVLNPS